jgi:GDP-L-fucose synthase
MRESFLMTGQLEPTNEGYALAKLVGIYLAKAYRQQYGLNVIVPMPCNVYGTGDHFDLERAHVLSALVARFVEAVQKSVPAVTLWGTGEARREFIHVDDLAAAILLLLESYDDAEVINVGTGVDVTIRELANAVAFAAGYRGRIEWDPSRPDGMPRKCLDVSRLTALGFRPSVGLDEGIRRTIEEYRQFQKERRLP